MVLHPDGHIGHIPDTQGDIAVHGILGRDFRNGVSIGQGGDGAGDRVEGQHRALLEEGPVSQIFFAGPQQLGQPVRQLGKGPQQERKHLHRILHRDAGLAAVDQGIEGSGTAKAHFAGAAGVSLGHAAALPGEMEGAAGAVLHRKAQGYRCFQFCQDGFCFVVHGAQIFQRCQHAVHVYIGHCLCFRHR